MEWVMRRIRALVAGAAIGLPIGYLQGGAVINVLHLLQESPLGGLAGEASTLLQTAIASYGIWAYIGASVLRGLLLFVILPEEVITPLYVLETARTPLDVAVIAVIGAATVTAANLVIYLLSRLAGRWIDIPAGSGAWRFVEWLVVEHGRISMYLLRLIPWVGAWAAVPAGLARLNVRTFLIYSFLGFLTYDAILGYAAFYGIKSGNAAVPLLPAVLG